MSEHYLHGMGTSRKGVTVPSPVNCTNNVVVAIGTAPVHLADNAADAVNKPIALWERKDADELIGASMDFAYTLNHSVYAAFNIFGIAPIVVINVLDPSNANHVEAIAGEEIALTGGKAVIEEQGVLLDKVVVNNGETVYELDKDYVVSFNDEDYPVIAVTSDGALAGKDKITVSYSKLNPEGVTAEDIIGGVDENGVRTGIELLDEIYPRFGIVPGIVTAPGFSKNPAVAAALDAKAQKIYGLTNAISLTDLDSSENGANHFSKVPEVKAKSVVASRWTVPLWPMVKVDEFQLYFSAQAAAMMQKIASDNNNIPSDSPDNHDLLIDGICLEDGTEVFMTQEDVNDYLNKNGVAGALKLPTWKFWGNNTAAYPASTDPIERWIKCVTMLNFMENKFKTEYLSSVGRNASYKLISSVVNSFNMWLNSLTPDHLAGGEIVFDRKENPLENILAGRMKFRTRYADYTPAEYIENEFEYDTSILENALGGGADE